MKTFLFLVLLASASVVQAQYYYEDVIGTAALNGKMKIFIDNGVKSITATGLDNRGVKTTDYNEWQEIDAANNILKITTRNGQQVTRQIYKFDGQLRVISVSDSSTDIKTTTAYNYENNYLISIKSTIDDTLQGLSQTEEHQWKYGPAGKPEKMWRIINNRDSSDYRFSLDDNGNVVDEKRYLRDVPVDSIFYYYDDDNRLTDVVRYDKKVKRLLPDFMFEYDDSNRVIQKISTLSSFPPDYLIWRYLFNEKGLKTKEALFNKNKELQGRIEYAYIFN